MEIIMKPILENKNSSMKYLLFEKVLQKSKLVYSKKQKPVIFKTA